MNRSPIGAGVRTPARHQNEESFHDALYDWMERAPWLAISFVAHLVFYFLLAAIPWHEFERKEVPILQTTLTPPEEEFFVPEEEEIIEPLPVDDVDTAEVVDSVADVDDFSETPTDAEDAVEAPFDPSPFMNSDLGIGGGAAGGDGGGRGRPARRGRAPAPVLDSVREGLDWLAEHQSADGHWDGDDFAGECELEGPLADGAGSPLHDVGLTGLAVLAFLGWGDTPDRGDYADNIRRGLTWLRREQSATNGRIGPATTISSAYDHAIATLALCEAFAVAPNPLLARDARRAIGFIQVSRNPYSAWRYANPGDGTSDTSVTGWMVLALAGAQKAGLDTDLDAFRGALAWVEEVTDPTDGRVGYTALGEGSARQAHLIDRYPIELSEAMTAAGLLTRAFVADALDQPLTADDRGARIVDRGVDRLLAILPEWDDSGDRVDLYYWYYASYALHQLSGTHADAWRRWERHLVATLLPAQRKEPPCFKGSFDPIGPWGGEGGRVYSTALAVLSLEVFFRYERLGAK